MRLFFAVGLDEAVRSSVGRTVDALRPYGGKARWVRCEDAHVTLAFLGEQAPERTPDLGRALRAAASRVPPFRLSVGSPGVFDSWDRPRVLWLGVAEGAAELRRAAAALGEALQAVGIPPERREFHPHITLARLDPRLGARALRAAVGRLPVGGASMDIESVELMRSDPRGVPRYDTVLRQDLRKEPI